MPRNTRASKKAKKPASKETEQQAIQKPETKAQLRAKAKADAKINAAAKKANRRREKSSDQSAEKPLRKVFILARPFVAIGRYLRDSWRELRQVRWPNRKSTWQMTLAVLVYCAIFIVFIVILDSLFTFIFNQLLGA